MSARLSSNADYESLLDKYDTWMFDCDGVLWHGDRLIEGAVQVLDILRRRNKKVLFVTNNATKSRKSYKGKFDQLGVEAHVDEIYGSAYAAAVYISSVVKLPKEKKVYVIGMKGLEEELHDEGLSFLGGTDPADSTVEPFSLADFTLDPDVGAVVCGLDTAINYTKLSKAFQYLTRNPGCLFLATNEDSTYPAGGGLLPGAGAISAPLRYALGKDPIAIGKPASTMLDCIKAKVDYDPKRTIMVGDRLNTDILFGQNGGLATLLVLTGITTEAEITGPNASSIVPDYVTASIGDLRVLGE
ncbi:4-nitrophenylphosphatase [Mycena indigotica]|uniref:4-nitrophenylphosphatase n=1 Tax=Mycena indigotica TaxID=2126181 RepID=A0A8H6SN30_9AGAR|nr:4-nitrophenylphosphatase [Mycena indigotica]KAF7301837.1 4-nitrophenylphosphatase [Mycena indigotica]